MHISRKLLKSFTSFQLFLPFLSLPLLLPAQSAVPYPSAGQRWQTSLGYVPSSTSTIVSASNLVLLGGGWLSNVTGSAVTVTVSDASTACGGAGCPLLSAVSVPANSVAALNFGGLEAKGVTWSASSGSAVVGWVWGNYVQSQITEVFPSTGPAMSGPAMAMIPLPVLWLP